MVMQPTYLTREGYHKLEQELNYLSTVRREEVARVLHEALQEGKGLLEDAILENARNDQAFVEGRILELKSILSNAIVINEAELPGDRVAMGSTVTIVEVGKTGAPETYRIVGPVEADPLNGKISHESPLGRALMGSAVGDEVVVNAPDGEAAFRIVGIHHAGEKVGKGTAAPERARRFSRGTGGRAVACPAAG